MRGPWRICAFLLGIPFRFRRKAAEKLLGESASQGDTYFGLPQNSHPSCTCGLSGFSGEASLALPAISPLLGSSVGSFDHCFVLCCFVSIALCPVHCEATRRSALFRPHVRLWTGLWWCQVSRRPELRGADGRHSKGNQALSYSRHTDTGAPLRGPVGIFLDSC